MIFKFQNKQEFSAGGNEPIEGEKNIIDLDFKVHKFSHRLKPSDKRNIVIFPIFSEFGCETLAAVYCLPALLAKFPGKYSIVMGWSGRPYLYRHLVDEFWELPEKHMWLREYCRAFHHTSRNLKRMEKNANRYGLVVNIVNISNLAVFPYLDHCPNEACAHQGIIRETDCQKCLKCGGVFPRPGFFHDIARARKQAVWLPEPCQEKVDFVKRYLPKNPVGITARHRKTWGRNLQPIFYERLIFLLEDLGYSPVWLGEKVTSLSCPFKRIFDFSNMVEAKDMETTLALVSLLQFTIQFWTASSRLAALTGTPYILFESPDQIWGNGQEGLRLKLLTRGHYKLVICHYKRVYEDNSSALLIVEDAVKELQVGNFADIVGMVENKDYVKFMKACAE